MTQPIKNICTQRLLLVKFLLQRFHNIEQFILVTLNIRLSTFPFNHKYDMTEAFKIELIELIRIKYTPFRLLYNSKKVLQKKKYLQNILTN